MFTRRFAAAFAGALALALTGCTEGIKGSAPAGPAAESPRAPGAPLSDERFHERLLTIAQNYKSFGQVDEKLRWAPVACAAYPSLGSPPAPPPRAAPPELHVSASSDDATHGRKLYAVFAALLNGQSYIKAGEPSPVGQEIVKESWVPEEVQDDGKPLEPAVRAHQARAAPPGDKPQRESDSYTACWDRTPPSATKGDTAQLQVESYIPYARKDGKLYHAAKQADLFIMFKMDPETPGTDQGWVYGTVTADGKQVTSAGRVESCMQCHAAAPHDRLFGLPKE